jgi:hypothetical protein
MNSELSPGRHGGQNTVCFLSILETEASTIATRCVPELFAAVQTMYRRVQVRSQRRAFSACNALICLLVSPSICCQVCRWIFLVLATVTITRTEAIICSKPGERHFL